MRVPNILACVLVVGIASVASAGASAIKGTVLASDSLPLPGVTVTLEKCGMAPKTTMTGDDGSYSFPDLEAGSYTLTFSLLGFVGTNSRGIVVVNEGPTNLSTVLKIDENIEDCIDCHNGAAPLINTYNTSDTHHYSFDHLQLIPSNRDPWSFLDQTPGVDLGMSEDKRIR